MGDGEVQVVASGIRKRFGRLEVLKGIDLTVDRGEVIVIMGVSGSGKTTLIRCINFLEEPDEGRIEVCGIEVECGQRTDGAARRKLSEPTGPAGIGAVLRSESGEILGEIARGIGVTTNNVAEYTGRVRARSVCRADRCIPRRGRS